MFLGYNTNGFAHHRLEDVIEVLAELGYRGIGLTADYHTIDPLADRWVERARRIDRRLRQARMRVVIETGARFILDPRRKHQPTLLDPDRHAALDRLYFLEACVRLGAALEADAVSFWSGAAPDNSPPRIHMARLVEACLRLSDFAGDRGLRLAFEPEPGMFIDSMDKFAELHGKVNRGNFGLTLDVGHLVCQAEMPVCDHIRRWKDWLWNVHFEDMRKGVHEHLMFGEGEVDFADAVGALREVGYRRGVYVELSRHSHDAVETARKSMSFLKAIPRPTSRHPAWWDGLDVGPAVAAAGGEAGPAAADELTQDLGASESDQVGDRDEHERQPDGGPGGAGSPPSDMGRQPAGPECADEQGHHP